MLLYHFFYLQKKANLALLEQEQAKARAEAWHQEKLREEERKISEALEESKKVRCVSISLCVLPLTLITKLLTFVYLKPPSKPVFLSCWRD